MRVAAQIIVCLAVGSLAQQYTTPVPILKQINRHNEDGSYSYGYEAADGSFKIETKHPSGDVVGKYGYVDDAGKLREVEYGANKFGFQPSGTDIMAAPPTINNNNVYSGSEDYDDGQYREDPSIYYKNSGHNSGFKNQHRFTQNNFNNNPAPQQFQNPAPSPQPAIQQRFFNHQPHNPYTIDPNQFRGHPASNFDIHSGSYSVNYSG